jgi:hypothetical protein
MDQITPPPSARRQADREDIDRLTAADAIGTVPKPRPALGDMSSDP